MAYTALYRKYRPDRFADVVGQEHITLTLTNELNKGSVFHAYLFTGPRGTGKTSCAKILAKAINCESPVNGDACCKCDACRRIAAGDDLDIIEMDAASNRGIADINGIRDRVNYMPSLSKYRVFIVDEVHMLTTEAFNALLKTLEEPPAHVVFVLATTEVHKLPATILSRCQRFDFRRIDTDDVFNRIKYVAQCENISIDDDAAMLIASMSDGGMRDALSTLDLCAANGEKITVQSVRLTCALAGSDHLLKLADYILNSNIGSALELINDLYKNSVDMQRLCEELSSHYRNLMLAKTTHNYKKLISLPADELENVKTQADNYRISHIMLSIRVLGEARAKMNNQNRRAELEMAVVKLCMPQVCGGVDSLEDRISKLETLVKGISNGSVAVTPAKTENIPNSTPVSAVQNHNAQVPESDTANASTAPASKKAIEHQAAAAVEASPVSDKKQSCDNPAPKSATGIKPFAEWKRVLKELKKTSPIIEGGLNGSAAYIENGKVLIDCPNKVFIDMLCSQAMFGDNLKKALLEVTGEKLSFGEYVPKSSASEEQDGSALDDIVNKLSKLQIPDKYE